MAKISRVFSSRAGRAKQAGMLGLSIEVSGFDEFRRVLSVKAERVRDLRPVWEKIALDFYRSEAQIFGREGAYGSFPARKPLSQKWLDFKVAHGWSPRIMVMTGALRQSLTRAGADGGVLRQTPMSMTIGTSIRYAHYHQHGKGRNPVRQMVFVNDSQRQRWVRMIADHVMA